MFDSVLNTPLVLDTCLSSITVVENHKITVKYCENFWFSNFTKAVSFQSIFYLDLQKYIHGKDVSLRLRL